MRKLNTFKLNKRKKKTLQANIPMMEINTTPLIDVMLVLLVMLIITIPVQLHHVKLNMPTSSPMPKPSKPEVLNIDITENDIIQLNGVAIENQTSLEKKLFQEALNTEQPEIHLHADPKAKYQLVAKVLSSVQNAGLKKLGIVGLEVYSK